MPAPPPSEEPSPLDQARETASTAHAWALAAVVLLAWWMVDDFVIPAVRVLADSSLSLQQQLDGVGRHSLAVLPIALAYCATNRMRAALRGFADGDFFSAGPARAVAAAGEYALSGVFAVILVVPTLSSWIFGKPFDLDIQPLYVGLGVFALFVVAIGHILRVAAELKADSDAII